MLNTMYITSENAYISLTNDNLCVSIDGENVLTVPLLNLEGIMMFGYKCASPALMGACAERGISLCFFKPNGRFLARVCGQTRGNIILRHEQYRIAEDEAASAGYAKDFLIGKLHNSIAVLQRALRDYEMRIDSARINMAITSIHEGLCKLSEGDLSMDIMRGIEGKAAQAYFSVFDEMILQQKNEFAFTSRSRRPPLDRTNALLSFIYSILANDVAAALEGVGLDPYEGFLHRERPGRKSLALDMMEEMRPVLADRFVLSLINLRRVQDDDFIIKGSGGVIMTDKCRKTVLKAWQERKGEEIEHPFLKEKMKRGLICFAQAQLLARKIRCDLDRYPPYFWK